MSYPVITYLKEKKIGEESFADFLKKGMIFILVAIAGAAVFPSGKSLGFSDYAIGSVVTKEIIAPFAFPILKTPAELEKQRNEAVSKVPLVFEFNADVATAEIQRFRSSLNFIDEYIKAQNKKTLANLEVIKNMPLGQDINPVFVPELDSLGVVFRDKFQITISRARLNDLLYISLNGQLPQLKRKFERILKKVYAKVIIDVEKDSLANKQLLLRRGGINTERNSGFVTDLDEARSQAMVEYRESLGNAHPYIGLGPVFVHSFILSNWFYSGNYTQHLRRDAIASVPTSSGFVYKNERIVDSHQIVTKDIYQKLQSFAAAVQEQNFDTLFADRFKSAVGRFLFALLVISIFASYIYFFRYKKIWASFSKLILINLVVVIEIIIAWLILEILHWPEYAVPMIFAPVLLVILLDGSIAFTGAIIVALFIGTINGMDYVYTFINMFAGIIAIYSIRKISKRTQIFSASLVAWFAYVFGILTVALLRYQSSELIFDRVAIISINVIFTPLLAYGVSGVFEKVFDITTEFTLLELSDMNHPLLKRLSLNASGTFSHSIEVGNLAEAGAKAINSNTLLTRVGCYYHDIGKMEKPEYFVENQQGGVNRHDNLSPTMSSLVISSHVKLGLELADKYNIPADIKAFIPEHHGTSPMVFFLHKAKEANPDTEIDESNFRYPGPRPQSKETAIVMLADSIEAASRVLKEPSASRIQALIDSLVDKKISDRQLDECGLTFKDISEVKNAFAHYLMSKFHLRIEYPEEATKNPTPSKVDGKKSIKKKTTSS